MKNFEDVTINEVEYDLENNEKGKLVIFIYPGPKDPVKVLDSAIKIYTDGNDYYEFVDINMDNPWTRVIISNINGIKQKDFDPETDRINNFK